MIVRIIVNNTTRKIIIFEQIVDFRNINMTNIDSNRHVVIFKFRDLKRTTSIQSILTSHSHFFVNFRIKLFSKNEKLNQISKQYRKMKTLSNRVNQQSYFQQSMKTSRRSFSNYSKNYYLINNKRSTNDNLTFKKKRIFRSQNVMIFDLSKHFVEFFIRRFE